MGLLVAGLGLKGLTRAKRLKNKQKSKQNFNRLIESSTEIAYGEIGDERKARLNLYGSKIIVNNKIIKLKNGSETLKIIYLPLPLEYNGKNKYSIRNGIYKIKLAAREKRTDYGAKKRFFLQLTEI